MTLNAIKQKIVQKIKFELGVTKLEEDSRNLFYLLENSIDITKIPPTKNEDLRILQKCDAILLAIFDKLCIKYGLTYWIDYGTLLGAYRHKGFIPWDDDIDVTMPREDINKVLTIMRNEIEEMGFSLKYSPIHPLRGLILSYNYEKTGVWIDLFSVDNYNTDADETLILDTYKEYRNFFLKNKHLSSEELTKKKKNFFSVLPHGNNKYLLPLLEGWNGEICLFYNQSFVFPLTKMQFEGFEFFAPANPDLVLQRNYGNSYMQFPHVAINNHGQTSKVSISKRAKSNGINMNDVYYNLLSIYNKLVKEDNK